jgi:hypothetical protein
MDTAYTQSMVAYGSGPKEVNTKRGMHDGDKQFGKANKMPQENKGYKQKDYSANPDKRHCEYR